MKTYNEHKQVKSAKLCVNIRSWMAKNSPKLSSKYLKDRIWKIKQYLNYILVIINQNILAILWTFFNLQKNMKLYTKCTSTAATTEFVWKIPNRKKIPYEHFNLCESEIFLSEIIKQRHAKLLEKRKWSVTLHKTKVKKMNPCE